MAQATIDPSLHLEMKKHGAVDKIKVGIIMREQTRPACRATMRNTAA